MAWQLKFQTLIARGQATVILYLLRTERRYTTIFDPNIGDDQSFGQANQIASS
jgi:hypothetical protein